MYRALTFVDYILLFIYVNTGDTLQIYLPFSSVGVSKCELAKKIKPQVVWSCYKKVVVVVKNCVQEIKTTHFKKAYF